jgi:hypothetical protein
MRQMTATTRRPAGAKRQIVVLHSKEHLRVYRRLRRRRLVETAACPVVL